MKKMLLVIMFFFFVCPAYASEQLIIEPEMGRAPLLSAINNSQSSIDIVLYGLTDEDFIHALTSSKQQGKKVRVLLESNPYLSTEENQPAIRQLKKADIATEANKHSFQLIHQKTFILDDKNAIVMTCNLTHGTFTNERNFALVITDPAMVQEISQVFNADWQGNTVSLQHNNLIWSPDNSRRKLLHFIHDAQSSIKIYAQNITDYKMKGALVKAAKSGISVQVILPDTEKNNPHLDYLRNAGVQLRFSPYLIHAKVIVVDQHRAILGSMNFTKAGIDRNRELSVITDEPQVIQPLNNTFEQDWQKSSIHNGIFSNVPHFPYSFMQHFKQLKQQWLA